MPDCQVESGAGRIINDRSRRFLISPSICMQDKEALVAALLDASVRVPPLSKGTCSRGLWRSGDGSMEGHVGATAAEVAKLREQLVGSLS